MKNKILAVLGFCVLTATLCSGETFDITTYKPPSAWKIEQKEGAVVYSTTGESGQFCIIGLYKGRSLHYFEGIGETNLVLQPSAQTNRDGGFSGNSDFPNSYLFSSDDRLEFRY